MKVGLEVSRMHDLSKTRGIGIYAQNLYESIKKYTDIDIELIGDRGDYDKFDLIHFPFFDLFKHTLPLRISKPFIVTIPDLIPLQFPKHYPPGLKGRANLWMQKMAIKQAAATIAISKTVKNDVEKILKISPDKVFSVHLAPSSNYKVINDKNSLKEIKNKYSLPEEFVLYVGNVNWNKNILNTAEACIKANRNLVIIGSSFLDKTSLDHPEKKSLKSFLEKYGNNSLVKILGFVKNDEMVGIMNLATILIFVSYYEGFGLPILEAQACGLPVLTSNLSATKEVSGDGAVLVDPYNPDEIAMSINKLCDSVDLRKKIISAGKENLERFSWQKTARKTVEVYEKCF